MLLVSGVMLSILLTLWITSRFLVTTQNQVHSRALRSKRSIHGSANSTQLYSCYLCYTVILRTVCQTHCHSTICFWLLWSEDTAEWFRIWIQPSWVFFTWISVAVDIIDLLWKWKYFEADFRNEERTNCLSILFIRLSSLFKFYTDHWEKFEILLLRQPWKRINGAPSVWRKKRFFFLLWSPPFQC